MIVFEANVKPWIAESSRGPGRATGSRNRTGTTHTWPSASAAASIISEHRRVGGRQDHVGSTCDLGLSGRLGDAGVGPGLDVLLGEGYVGVDAPRSEVEGLRLTGQAGKANPFSEAMCPLSVTIAARAPAKKLALCCAMSIQHRLPATLRLLRGCTVRDRSARRGTAPPA